MAKGKKTGGRDFAKGVSGCPGGKTKEQRDFLERMRAADGDAERIYAAFMRLVDEGNAPAIIRAVEYVAGKPKETVEVKGKTGPLFALLARMPSLSPADLETVDGIFRRAIGASGDSDGEATEESAGLRADDVAEVPTPDAP